MKIKNLIPVLFIIGMSLCSCLPKVEHQKEASATSYTPVGVSKEKVSEPIIQTFGRTEEFDFYGREIIVSFHKDGYLDFPEDEDADTMVSKIITGLKNSEIDLTFDQLIVQSNYIGLDDFGYKMLLKEFTEFFDNFSPNFKQVIMWYGLRKKGLDVIIYTDNNHLSCLFHTNEKLVERSFFTENDRKYYEDRVISQGYLIEEIDSKFFPNTEEKPLSFETKKLPKLGKNISTIERSFTFENREYVLPISYNEYIAQYLDDIPVRNIGKYITEMEISDEAKKSFDDSIPHWLENKTNYDKLDFLLKFVVSAFPYKRDRVEKYNFVEQSLRDRYTDCEDRTALFYYLVKEFLSVKTLLLLGPDHMCSAVQIDKDSDFGENANTFEYNEDRYLVCDPSDMNAKPGATAFSKYQLFNSTEVL